MPKKRDDAFRQALAALPRKPNGGDDPQARAYQAKVIDVKAQITSPPNGDEQDADVESLVDVAEKAMRIAHAALIREAAGQRHASKYTEMWLKLREVAERTDAIRYMSNLVREAYEQLMVDQLENEGTTMHRLESGAGVTMFPALYAKITDREAFVAWAKKDPDIATRVMPPNWAAVNSLCTEMMTIGEPEPPGIELMTQMRLRKLT